MRLEYFNLENGLFVDSGIFDDVIKLILKYFE